MKRDTSEEDVDVSAEGRFYHLVACAVEKVRNLLAMESTSEGTSDEMQEQPYRPRVRASWGNEYLEGYSVDL